MSDLATFILKTIMIVNVSILAIILYFSGVYYLMCFLFDPITAQGITTAHATLSLFATLIALRLYAETK